MRFPVLAALFFGSLSSLLAVDPAPKKLELFLMVPEPRAMRSAVSKDFAGAKRTVLSPAKQTSDASSVHIYSADEFAKLGVSVEKFLEKAQTAAEKRLATIQPELKKDQSGKIIYAVYRSDEPTIACLLIAPSLAKIFGNIFGKEVWAVAPDRRTLFIFPPQLEVIDEFADDLKDRFEDNPYAASDEIFDLKSDGSEPRVIGSFTKP